MDIGRLRNFVVHDNDVDTLIAVDSQLKALAGNYAERKLEIPDWIGEQGA